MDLPTLDLALFLDGTETQKDEVAYSLVSSFRKHGFVKLVNYGASEDFVQNIFRWSKQFFALPEDAKLHILNRPGPNPQRGWSRVGVTSSAYLRHENIQDAPNGDLRDEKEHFDCGPRDDSEFPNLWPRQTVIPGFREFMEDYFDLCHQISLNIIKAMERGLEIPCGTLVEKCLPAASELAINHYPALDIGLLKEGRSKRHWPHSDFGIISLVFQDSVGGLELEDRLDPGTFVPITSSVAELVVNISDTCERWTNGVIRAGLHRVVEPNAMKSMENGILPERFSSVFFFKAHRNASVGPLAQFVGHESPAKFDDISALEFHRQRTKIVF